MFNRLLIILFIISSYGLQSFAQFKATLKADGGDLVVYVIPIGGDITTDFSQIEFFIRTPDSTPFFTMGAPVVNSVDFQGNIPLALSGPVTGDGYKTFYFGYAPNTQSLSTATYTDGTEYELARVTLSDGASNSAIFELVSDLTTYDSYLTITSGGGDDLTFSDCIFASTCSTESVFYGAESSGSGFGLSTETTTDPVPLPVELHSFTGRNEGKVNILKWNTLSEENSSHFEIQKSADAEDFERMGSVEAAGNSANPLTYAFGDERPFYGNNYYRLKIVDLDGTYEYSEIILIKVDGKATVKGFPNPFAANISFELVSPFSGMVRISVFDVAGRKVAFVESAIESGFSTQLLKLDNLVEGAYIAQVLLPGANEPLTTKIIKSNK